MTNRTNEYFFKNTKRKHKKHIYNYMCRDTQELHKSIKLEAIIHIQKTFKENKCPDKNYESKITKILMSSFCIGHLLLGMGSSL